MSEIMMIASAVLLLALLVLQVWGLWRRREGTLDLTQKCVEMLERTHGEMEWGVREELAELRAALGQKVSTDATGSPAAPPDLAPLAERLDRLQEQHRQHAETWRTDMTTQIARLREQLAQELRATAEGLRPPAAADVPPIDLAPVTARLATWQEQQQQQTDAWRSELATEAARIREHFGQELRTATDGLRTAPAADATPPTVDLTAVTEQFQQWQHEHQQESAAWIAELATEVGRLREHLGQELQTTTEALRTQPPAEVPAVDLTPVTAYLEHWQQQQQQQAQTWRTELVAEVTGIREDLRQQVRAADDTSSTAPASDATPATIDLAPVTARLDHWQEQQQQKADAWRAELAAEIAGIREHFAQELRTATADLRTTPAADTTPPTIDLSPVTEQFAQWQEQQRQQAATWRTEITDQIADLREHFTQQLGTVVAGMQAAPANGDVANQAATLRAALEALDRGIQERSEQLLRATDEKLLAWQTDSTRQTAQLRQDWAANVQALREEISGSLERTQETLRAQVGHLATVQHGELEMLSRRIMLVTQESEAQGAAIRDTVTAAVARWQGEEKQRSERRQWEIETLTQRLREAFRGTLPEWREAVTAATRTTAAQNTKPLEVLTAAIERLAQRSELRGETVVASVRDAVREAVAAELQDYLRRAAASVPEIQDAASLEGQVPVLLESVQQGAADIAPQWQPAGVDGTAMADEAAASAADTTTAAAANAKNVQDVLLERAFAILSEAAKA